MTREVVLDMAPEGNAGNAEDTRPSQKIGRYVVVRELGRGGMGIVYEATDPEIGRHLAVKVINLQAFTTPEESTALRDRLFREARSAGALSHPGIVMVYDVGQDNELAYIAMELVDGPSLHEVLMLASPLDPAAKIEILRQAAAALDYAHQRGIVHRDIKPANIMLHERKQVKIADFGIARINFEPKYTMTGTVMGTPDYMSPEQIEAQSIDGRSDEFSLAVVAYELLTGITPFSGGSFASVMHRIVSGPRPSARTANPTLPAGVDEVLLRAMAQAPEQRYPTCAEFVQALDAAMQGVVPAAQAVVQGPPEAAVVAQPRRSPRWPLVLAGVVVLALALAGAGYRLGYWPKRPAAPQAPTELAVGTSQPPVPVTPAAPVSTDAPPPAATPPVAQTTPAIPAPGIPKSAPGGPAPKPVAAKSQSASPSVEMPSVAQNKIPPPVPIAPPAQPSVYPPPQPADPLGDLRKAAAAGNAAAMDRLGQMYERGAGVPQDAREAFRWYSSGAAAGQPAALYHLGTLYEAGKGTARNVNQAVRLYQQAAAAGNPDAQARLQQLPAASARPAPTASSPMAPAPPGAVSVRVSGNAPWTDTGIDLRAGDSVTVTASGLIAVEAGGRIPPKAPGGFAPDCAAAASIYGGRFGTFPSPRLPCWSLIGRVGGNGLVFEVGSKGSFRAGSNGRLLLGINDDSFNGNSGAWTAVVMVQRGR